MQGFELTTEQVIEVLSVYATAEQAIPAVTASPGWFVIGGFTMPAGADVRVDLLGSVTDAALTLRCRLYCVTEGFVGEVSGSTAQLSTTEDSQVFSGVFALTGGRSYQFQAEVTGDEGGDKHGSVRRATLQGIA